jgi:hypothetical protein
MTKDEALKMAIESMSAYQNGWWPDDITSALIACQRALEQPTQEPVANVVCLNDIVSFTANPIMLAKLKTMHNKPLYLHPKEWQGLSDDEVMELVKECKAPYHSHALEPRLFAKAIEQKLKEKNHGSD